MLNKVRKKFQTKYSHDKEFATRIRCLTALAFLPIEEVCDGFEELIAWDKSKEEPLIPQYVIDYFETYYIGKPLKKGGKQRKTPR